MYGDFDSNDTDKDHSDKKSSAKRFRCRFCNRSFSKSQALGGHMNGHRQERDNEMYSKAKALVEQKYGSSFVNMRMQGQSIQSNNYVAPQSYSAIPGGVQAHVEVFNPSQVQIGCSTSIPTYSNQNLSGGISRVGPSLNQKLQQQQQHQVFDQKVAGQYRNSPSIPSHPNCPSPSQVQIGCSTSIPTYSNQNVGGGISRVGPSLNQKLQQQQQHQVFDQKVAGQYINSSSIPSHPNCHSPSKVQIRCSTSIPTYSSQNVGGGISRGGPFLNQKLQLQQQQQMFDPNVADQYRNSPTIPSRLNCQVRGGASHPYLPYQTSMNNNLGVRGASLPMNSNLQIKEPSFPTLQGRDPNFLLNAPQPSEQLQQFFNVVPSPLSSWKVENPSL